MVKPNSTANKIVAKFELCQKFSTTIHVHPILPEKEKTMKYPPSTCLYALTMVEKMV